MPLRYRDSSTEKFKVFGAALDALDLPEKVALKLAYVESMRESPWQELAFDPYDAINNLLLEQAYTAKNVEWIGKFPIESRLSPKPLVGDEGFLTITFFTDFLDKNGCLTYREKLVSYLKDNVYPASPVMIGVDHSLTGGVLRYLAESNNDFNVVILDSHTDIIDFSTKRALVTPSLGKGSSSPPDIYECGSFIGHLLNENVIKADRLWILGTQDLPEDAERLEIPLYAQRLRDWVRKGVHLISKSDLVRHGIPEEIEGPTYISIDIDVGSYASVLACRFMDRIGLEYEALVGILKSLSALIKQNRISLLGLDVMELDVHFLNEEASDRRDCTLEILKNIFDELVFSESDRN
jgi:arginase family enzyme